MSSIDNRIVKMQFENSQFEKNVKESMNTLEKLKEKFNFKTTEKELESLQRAGDSFSFARMANGISDLTERFSIMGSVGMRVIQNLTDAAYRFGTNFVKSVSVDQISAGFSKYADKTKAVQTIVNATGLSIEKVDEQLSKLAWFTDETSYNFVDMVSNIGKFTSMNIPLSDSVTAMQGIATWAAVSGQGVNEASRAMYNLSQAIGVGSVKLMDWKSIENANMATSEFKQTVIDTAIAMKKIKKGQVTLENFDSTLAKGWFTKDVLMSVLSKYGEYADAVYEIVEEEGITAAEAMKRVSGETMQLGEKAFKAAQEAKTFQEAIDSVKDAVSTGWMNTFENVFGNYEEAKEIWTDLANGLWDVFASGAETRNELLATWKELGGRKTLLEGIYSIFGSIYNIIIAIKEAVHDIFPEITVDTLMGFSDKVKEFGDNVKKYFGYSEDEVVKWSNRLDEFQDLKFGDTTDAVKELENYLVELGYLDKAKAIGIYGPETEKAIKRFQKEKGLDPDGIISLDTLKELGKRGLKVGQTFEEAIKRGDRGENVKKLQEQLIELGYLDEKQADGVFGPKTEEAVKKYQKAQNILSDGIVNEDTFAALFGVDGIDIIKKETETVKKYGEGLQFFKNIAKGLFSVFSIGWKIIKFVFNVFKTFASVLSPVGSMFAKIADAASRFFTALNERLDKSTVFQDWLEKLQNLLGPVRDKIDQLCQSFLNLIGLSGNLDDIDFSQVVENLINSLKNFFGIGLEGAVDVDIDSKSMIEKIKEKITGVLVSIKDWITGLFSSSGNGEGSGGFGGINIVAIAMSALGVILSGQIIQLIGTFVGAGKKVNKILNNVKNITKSIENAIKGHNTKSWIETIGPAILEFAAAIGILAASVYFLSKLSWDQLAVGLVGLAAIIVLLVGSMFAMKYAIKGADNIDKIMAALIQYSAAIAILVAAVAGLGNMSWEELAKGLIGMVALVAILIVSIFALSKMSIDPQRLLSVASVFNKISIAIDTMTNAVLKLGRTDEYTLVKGLISLTAILLQIVLTMKFLDGIAIKTSAIVSLLAIALALDMLIAGFVVLSLTMKLMSLEDVLKSIGALSAIVISVSALLKLIDGINPSIKSVLALLPIALAIDLLIAGFVVMTIAMKMVSVSEIVKAFLGMTVIVLGMVALLKLIEKIHPSIGSILALLPMAIALDLVIGGFVALLITIRKNSFGDIVKAFAAITIIILGMVALLKLIEKIHPSVGSVLALLPMAIALDLVIAGFVALLVTLKNNTAGDIIKAFAAITIIVLSMTALLKLIEKIHPSIGSILALLPMAIALDLVIGGFIVLLMTLKNVDTGTVVKAIASFSAIMIMLTIVSKSLQAVAPTIMGAISMLIASIAMIGAMIAFSLVLKSIKDVDTGKIIAFSAGLSAVMVAFGALGIMANIVGPTGILLAAGAVLAIGIAIGALIAAFAYILSLPGVEQFLSGAAEKVGKIIGTMQGAMRAAEMKSFAKGMEGFKDIPEADEASMKNALNCAQLFADFANGLPDADFGSRILDWLVGSKMQQFSEDMVSFAKGFNSFADTMKEIEVTKDLKDNTKSAINIANSLSDLSEKLPRTYKYGKILSWFVSSEPLGNFSKDMASFAKGFDGYVKMMEGIPITKDLTNKSMAAVKIGKSYSELSENLPESYKKGPIESLFVSVEPLTKYAQDLEGFGEYFAGFAEMIDGIPSINDVKRKANTILQIAQGYSLLSSNLPSNYDSQGIILLQEATDPLTRFGKDMSGFADNINAFAYFISRIGKDEEGNTFITDTELKNKSSLLSTIATAYAELKLPEVYNQNGLGALIRISWPLEWFATDLTEFARGFNKFAELLMKIGYYEDGTAFASIDEIKGKADIVKGIAEEYSQLGTGLPESYSKKDLLSLLTSATPLTNFITDATSMAEGFNKFASFLMKIGSNDDGTTFTSTDDLHSKATIVKEIAAAYSELSTGLPSGYNVGALGSLFENVHPLTTFITDATMFAAGFTRFAQFIDSIGKDENGTVEFDAGALQEKAETVKEIAKAYSVLATDLPDNYNIDGFELLVKSATPLTNLSTDMTTFAASFTRFAEFINKVGKDEEGNEVIDMTGLTDKADQVKAIAEGLNGLVTSLPSNYKIGIVSSWFDQSSSPLSAFGTDIDWFGSLMNSYAESITSIKNPGAMEENTGYAIRIAESVAKFCDGLKDKTIDVSTTGLAGWFYNKETKQESVIQTVGQLAQAMKDNEDNFSGLSDTKIEADVKTAVRALSSIAGLLAYLGQTDVVIPNIEYGENNNLSNFLKALGEVANKVREFSDGLAKEDVENIASIISGIADIGKIFAKKEGEEGNLSFDVSGLDPQAIVDAITEFTSQIVAAIDLAISTITGKTDELKKAVELANELTASDDSTTEESTSAGSELSGGVNEGFASGDTSGASTLGRNLLKTILTFYDKFKETGGFLAKGLANGITENTSFIVTAAKTAMQKAIDAAKEVSDEGSPSRVMWQSGRFFDEGLANGIKENSKQVSAVAEKTMDGAMSSAKGVLSTLASLINEDIDDTPVIRPVVDLSDARSAASSIGGMFKDQSFSVQSGKLASKIAEYHYGTSASKSNQNDSHASGRVRNTTNNVNAGVTFSGNSFYVRDDRDVDSLANEIASIAYNQQRGLGVTLR